MKTVRQTASWRKAIAEVLLAAYLDERGKRGSKAKFLRALRKAPDVPPDPGDELPTGWKRR